MAMVALYTARLIVAWRTSELAGGLVALPIFVIAGATIAAQPGDRVLCHGALPHEAASNQHPDQSIELSHLTSSRNFIAGLLAGAWGSGQVREILFPGPQKRNAKWLTSV